MTNWFGTAARGSNGLKPFWRRRGQMLRIVIDVNTPAGYAQAVKEDLAMHLERWGDARVVAVEELKQGAR